MELLKIREHPERADEAAAWFYAKWGIPAEAYGESMQECLKNKGGVPQWYIAVEAGEIIGGIGVIEHDFHDRKDLTPNACALYVEEKARGRGTAGKLLGCACCDMAGYGIKTLYLMTSHTSFYERYGWEFFCMVQEEGDPDPSRMYRYRTDPAEKPLFSFGTGERESRNSEKHLPHRETPV